MKTAFFLVIMPWEMDLLLCVVGSSHSVLGRDGSSISEHRRAFLEMVLETVFSTVVTQVWTAS